MKNAVFGDKTIGLFTIVRLERDVQLLIDTLIEEIKKNTNIVAVFLVGEMIYYDDHNMLNQDYRYRIANSQSEVLTFDKITKILSKYFIKFPKSKELTYLCGVICR